MNNNKENLDKVKCDNSYVPIMIRFIAFIIGTVLLSAIILQTTAAQNFTANQSNISGNMTSTNQTPVDNSSSPRIDCDPSYPGVCIKSPPPNLNCPNITDRDFQVLSPDPHGFDGDNDGIGCES